MLTVIIISKNEQPNIGRCLQSVCFADEIIVLDSGSTDKTIDIAKQYTQHVYSTGWPGYGIQKQSALSRATGDWVLNLDADESVNDDLREEIQQAISKDLADAFRIPIQMIFYKQLLKYSGSPKRHIRLFKKANAHYSDDIVHEKIRVPHDARIKTMKYSIMHHSFTDVTHALYKINKYSSYSAKIHIASKKKPSFSLTLISTGWMFFRCYILQRGFLDGRAGFLLAVFSAQGSFYRGIKQLYRDKNTDKLPDLNQK